MQTIYINFADAKDKYDPGLMVMILQLPCNL